MTTATTVATTKQLRHHRFFYRQFSLLPSYERYIFTDGFPVSIERKYSLVEKDDAPDVRTQIESTLLVAGI